MGIELESIGAGARLLGGLSGECELNEEMEPMISKPPAAMP
jgi:hypothetical protein